MDVKLVYIQAQDGVPADESFFKAWEGFRKRNIPRQLFDAQQIHDGMLPLARNTLVAGGLRVVESALSQLGIPIPVADNLPACLSKYRGRKIWESTWGELRTRYSPHGPPAPLF